MPTPDSPGPAPCVPPRRGPPRARPRARGAPPRAREDRAQTPRATRRLSTVRASARHDPGRPARRAAARATRAYVPAPRTILPQTGFDVTSARPRREPGPRGSPRSRSRRARPCRRSSCRAEAVIDELRAPDPPGPVRIRSPAPSARCSGTARSARGRAGRSRSHARSTDTSPAATGTSEAAAARSAHLRAIPGSCRRGRPFEPRGERDGEARDVGVAVRERIRGAQVGRIAGERDEAAVGGDRRAARQSSPPAPPPRPGATRTMEPRPHARPGHVDVLQAPAAALRFVAWEAKAIRLPSAELSGKRESSSPPPRPRSARRASRGHAERRDLASECAFSSAGRVSPRSRRDRAASAENDGDRVAAHNGTAGRGARDEHGPPRRAIAHVDVAAAALVLRHQPGARRERGAATVGRDRVPARTPPPAGRPRLRRSRLSVISQSQFAHVEVALVTGSPARLLADDVTRRIARRPGSRVAGLSSALGPAGRTRARRGSSSRVSRSRTKTSSCVSVSAGSVRGVLATPPACRRRTGSGVREERRRGLWTALAARARHEDVAPFARSQTYRSRCVSESSGSDWPPPTRTRTSAAPADSASPMLMPPSAFARRRRGARLREHDVVRRRGRAPSAPRRTVRRQRSSSMIDPHVVLRLRHGRGSLPSSGVRPGHPSGVLPRRSGQRVSVRTERALRTCRSARPSARAG